MSYCWLLLTVIGHYVVFSAVASTSFAWHHQGATAAASATVVWVPLDEYDHFVIDASSVNDYLGSIVDGPWLAIADPESTNSSGLEYWPRLLSEASLLFGLEYDHHITGRYIVDCYLIDNLPDFVYRIGGADFVFPSSKYIDRDLKHSDPTKCVTVFAKNERRHPADNKGGQPVVVWGRDHLDYFGAIIDDLKPSVQHRRIGFIQPSIF